MNLNVHIWKGKKSNLIFTFLILPILLCAQINIEKYTDSLFNNKGEIYFSFKINSKKEINKISKIVSIDHNTNDTIAYAYANKSEYTSFLKMNIQHKIIEKKIIIYDQKNKNNWNYYPSYNEYVTIMQDFATNFPDICKLHSLGTLNSGREILIVQISDNVGVKENEPSFLYTSSMHGDELTGYVLMLRLIDYLLNNYGNNTRLTTLINEIDIWINPLANPDGAYAGGNQNIWAATRYNASYVDLNRNFPDPEDGNHPDGFPWQEETVMFMGLSDTIKFDLSSNLHTGTELANYPWDTWGNLTADDNWWRFICQEYADSCQTNGSSGYFDSQNNGITNGYDWYEVNGGRQDYMNYFNQCREFTLELSNYKIPDPNNLPYYWNSNFPSLINFMEQSLYGLRGIVSDSITGNPIKAKIEIVGHDLDSSHIYSKLPIGNYHRYLYQGNYNITFSKAGYYSKTINENILNKNTTILNIKLVPISSTGVQSIYNNYKFKTLDILGRPKVNKENIQMKIEISKNGQVNKLIRIE